MQITGLCAQHGVDISRLILLLEKDEEIYQLKEKLKDMERRLQESQDKLNQRDQALALEGNSE